MVAIIGIVFTGLEIVILFSDPEPANIWDGIVGIIVILLLLLSMYDKIKFIPYQWWMVLILGFILYGWVVAPILDIGNIMGLLFILTFPLTGTGGTLILVSFILMLLEK